MIIAIFLLLTSLSLIVKLFISCILIYLLSIELAMDVYTVIIMLYDLLGLGSEVFRLCLYNLLNKKIPLNYGVGLHLPANMSQNILLSLPASLL